jgi:hypothetical protein
MTLKEKFRPLVWFNSGSFNVPQNREKDENSIKCEQIADEYAIGFVEWFTNEKSEYSIMYGNQEKIFATFTKDYTAKELLEIYKKEKGL